MLSAVAFALGGGTISTGSASSTVPLAPHGAFAIAPVGVRTALVYVANYAANSVTAYPTSASGNVRPAITLAGPHTRIVQPVAVAHDPQGRLFVASGQCVPGSAFCGGEVLIFARGANGDAAPVRSFQVTNYPGDGGPGGVDVSPVSLAVDGSGYTYVGDEPYYFQVNTAFVVYGPAAQGADAPLRVFAGYAEGAPQVAVNEAGQVYIMQGPDRYYPAYLARYSAFAAGNVFLGGPNTGPNDFFPPGGLAVAPRSGNLYVLNINSSPLPSIIVWDPTFAKILGRIRGNAAGLGNHPSGIAVDGTGQVYIGAPDGALPNSLEIFSAGARGNVAPSRTIAGPNTGLNDPVAITLIDSAR